ncbi:terminase small subunit [Aminobacter sp. UC22_36]|uniref:terminase small subunit n=1 Tax=Aminobacter sp. UC22_36 TaxID=3374549 RepID=UPI003757F5AF
MVPETAYAEAGFKPHRQNAARLMSNDDIMMRVAELQTKTAEKAEIDIVRVLQELVRLGTSDVRAAFDENGNLKRPEEWSDEFAASVASIEVVTRTLGGTEIDEDLEGQPHGGALRRSRAPVEYVHKIKMWDKNSALEKIAKHLGMFIERKELTVTHRFEDIPDDELDREIASLAGSPKAAGKTAH